MKRLKTATAVLALACLVLTGWLVGIYRNNKAITDQPNYTIYIEEDGKTEIIVRDIGLVRQKPDGTLIIQGDGKPVKLR